MVDNDKCIRLILSKFSSLTYEYCTIPKIFFYIFPMLILLSIGKKIKPLYIAVDEMMQN